MMWKIIHYTKFGLRQIGFVFYCLFLTYCSYVAANTLEISEPETIKIPTGPFIYGRTNLEKEIYITHDHESQAAIRELPTFFIGKYEVSNNDFSFFIRDGGYYNQDYWSEEGWSIRKKRMWTAPRKWYSRFYHDERKRNLAVVSVSWYEAEAYCRWLAMRTGKPYRLPTEHEWVKAARGTDDRVFPWGNEWNPKACNWFTGKNDLAKERDEYYGPAPIQSIPEGKSPFGCFHMIGNVMEWCSDWWTTPSGDADTRYKVIKGGCYHTNHPHLLRISWRGGHYPDLAVVYEDILGFRVARNALEGEE
jgi:formylglycine-generating enzyme required for sulfatase activity